MEKYQTTKIGFLGGSFDPVHKGHLIISKIVIKKLKLKKIYWVVTKKNPFKIKAFYSIEKRIKKIKKFIKKIRGIEVLYIEDKVKSSRSIDAIKFILKKEKLKSLYFIIGSDILLEFDKWKSWKKIVKLTKLVVLSRRGYDKKGIGSTVVKYLNKKNIIFIKNRPIQISSSLLRNKMKIN